MVVDTLSPAFAALSDPTRRQLVDRLARGPAPVRELAKPFAMSQQAVSKHLAYLARARLIEKRRAGRQQFCALRPDALREVAAWAEGYRQFWERSYRRLDVLLEAMQAPRTRARPRQGGHR